MKKFVIFAVGILAGAIPTALAASTLFTDVDESAWYRDAVYSLQEKGIIEGYDDDTFRPGNNVNRAELAVTLDRLISYMGGETEYTLSKMEMTDSIPEDSEGFAFTKDVYSDSYFLDGDTLYTSVGFGGCFDHDFQMMWDGKFQDEGHSDIYVIQDATDDSCQDYHTQVLKFNLNPVRVEYKKAFPESDETIHLSIYNGASKTDKLRVDYNL